MKSSSISVGGAITVLNGIALGKGATIGTSNVHTISIEPADKIEFEIDKQVDTELIEACITEFSDKFDQSVDEIKISTDVMYPPAKGMKTSSAVSCGILHTLITYYDQELITEDVINLSASASIEAGVSITGAIDDAYASYLGGFHVTDNLNRKLLATHKLQINRSVIFIIPETSNLKTDITTEFDLLDTYILEKAFKEALDGDWKHAIQRNSRVYGQYYLKDWDILNQMEDMVQGTLGLNGAGPSLFLVCQTENVQDNLTILSDEYSQYLFMTTELRF